MYLTAPIELENMRSGAAQTFANSRGGDPDLRMRVAADPGAVLAGRGARIPVNAGCARRRTLRLLAEPLASSRLSTRGIQ